MVSFCRSATATKARRTEFKKNHLIVPPLVNDPIHIGCNIVTAETFPNFKNLEPEESSKKKQKSDAVSLKDICFESMTSLFPV